MTGMVKGIAAQQHPTQQLLPSALFVNPACTNPQHASVRHCTDPRLSQSPRHPKGPCFHPSLATLSRKLPAGTQREVQMPDMTDVVCVSL